MFSVEEIATRLFSGDALSTETVVTIAAATALAVVIAVKLSKAQTNPDPFDALPVPESTLPILGNTLDMGKYQAHRVHDWFAEQSAKVGGKAWKLTVLGRPPTVVVTSPDHLEDVTKRQLDNFPRGKPSQEVTHDFLGRGIIVADGRDWYFQRKVSSHLFSMTMMQDVMHDIVREKTRVLCQVLDEYVARSEPEISLKRELMHFTSDVFAKIGFGIELHCLESGLHGETHEFVKAFSLASIVTKQRFHVPRWLWRFKRQWGIGGEGELKRAMQVINDFTYKVINDSIAAKANKQSDYQQKDLISLFLSTNTAADRQEINGGDEQAEMTFIRDMAINFIFAGKDTTSVSLAWFVVMMNRYPKVLATIRFELLEHLPALFDRSSTFVPRVEDLKPLVFLDAAIRENLRLNTPAASVGRTAVNDTLLSDGTPIRKGTRVVTATYAAARQPTVWGPDAAEFIPERWIDGETNSIRKFSPTQAFVFSAGRRMCPGRNLAMLEMKVALAVLLSRYDFATVEDPWEITYEVAITHAVQGELMVQLSALGPQ